MIIKGNVNGSVSNVANNNSGVIGENVNIGTLNQFNSESLSQRLHEANWPRSFKAVYNADLGKALVRDACTPGTRVDILERLNRWAEDVSSDSPSIFWLTGQGGSGKSTIAYSTALHFDSEDNGSKIVLVNFFCSRQFEETRERKYIIPTVVEQMARQFEPYANALLQAKKFHSAHIPSKQMKDLLKDPWQKVMNEHAEELPSFLVVIDALDEVEDGGGSIFLGELLEMINDAQLKGIKFLVTSRPDPRLANLCSSFSSDAICRLYEVPTDTVGADIVTYLKAKLPDLQGTPELNELIRQADGLFIFAATALRSVTPRPSLSKDEKIQILHRLGIGSPGLGVSLPTKASLIDGLYQQIMGNAFEGLEGGVLQDRLDAFHILFCTQERVSPSVAGELFGKYGMIERIIDDLHAVLYLKDGRVLWYHASFPDFIFSPARSGNIRLGGPSSPAVDMHCDEAVQHERIARSCFRIMKSSLHFNICGLPSSFLFDSEVLDLDDRIRRSIGDSLGYTCQHWSQHLNRTSSEDGRSEIREFLEITVLFWIEVMNMLTLSARCSTMLQEARVWILNGKGSLGSNLAGQVAEAANFATYFVGSPAAKSTPHLYMSALATWPQNSMLSHLWKRQFSHVPAFQHTTDNLPLLTMHHDDQVAAVAISNDGTRIASCSSGRVHVWDASTGKELNEPMGQTDIVWSVAFSTDGSRIASGSSDNSVQVWDASTGKELKRLNGHTDHVLSVAFSTDGARIASSSRDHSVRVWDASTGRELNKLNGHTRYIQSVAFSTDGTRIASGSDDESVRVWNASTGKELNRLNGHDGFVFSVAFSTDGTRIASGSSDESVRVWDASTGKELNQLNGHTSGIRSVAFSTDGTRIVSGSNDYSVRVWDVSTGKELKRLDGHTSFVRSVAFSTDGTRIASGSWDQSVRVWDSDPSTGKELKRPNGHTGYIQSVAFSTDGTCIASGSEDNSVRVWDASTGKELNRLNGHTGHVLSVAYSTDGTCIASGSEDKSVRVWDSSTGRELNKLNGHTDAVWSVAFSTDGTRIVSGSKDKSVRLWDASTGKELKRLNGHTGWVYSVAFSTDGTRIVSGGDKSVRVWDASTGKELNRLNGHTQSVRSVAFSADGTRIVSGSDDKSVRVWDASTGKELSMLDGHTKDVRSVAFSTDGTCIASGSRDESVRIWDASTGKELNNLKGHTWSVSSVAFSPDGTRIASGSWDQSLQVWDICGHSDPWESTPEGWIVSQFDQRRFMWLSQDFLQILGPTFNSLTISMKPSANVAFTNLKMGLEWAACYTPQGHPHEPYDEDDVNHFM